MTLTRPKKIVAVVLTYALALGVGVGVAHALSHDTGLHAVGNLTSYCYYGQAKAIVPAANGAQVDVKAFVYKKQRGTACSTTYAAVNFYKGEAEVQVILYRASDMAVCASTGRVSTPNTVSSWGVGKTWNKSGTCATATSFVVGAAGDWQVILNKEFRGPNTGAFPI